MCRSMAEHVLQGDCKLCLGHFRGEQPSLGEAKAAAHRGEDRETGAGASRGQVRGRPRRGEVYIGRGSPLLGLRRSKWANLFRVGPGCSREGAVVKYEKYLDRSGLRAQVGELAGKVLLYLCPLDRRCHGDVLLEAIGRAGFEVTLNGRRWGGQRD